MNTQPSDNKRSAMTCAAYAIQIFPNEVPPRMSTWTNPTKDTVRFSLAVTRTVRVKDSPEDPEIAGATPGIRPTAHVAERQANVPQPIELAPGESIELPSMFDKSIKGVLCQDEACRNRGGYCTKDHPGVASAGLAPQLVKTGSPARLHPVLADHGPQPPTPPNVTPIASSKARRRVEG